MIYMKNKKPGWKPGERGILMKKRNHVSEKKISEFYRYFDYQRFIGGIVSQTWLQYYYNPKHPYVVATTYDEFGLNSTFRICLEISTDGHPYDDVWAAEIDTASSIILRHTLIKAYHSAQNLDKDVCNLVREKIKGMLIYSHAAENLYDEQSTFLHTLYEKNDEIQSQSDYQYRIWPLWEYMYSLCQAYIPNKKTE